MLYRIDYLNGEGRFRLVMAEDARHAALLALSLIVGNGASFERVQSDVDNGFFLVLPATEDDVQMVNDQGGVPPLQAENVPEVLPFDLTHLRVGQDRYEAQREQVEFMLADVMLLASAE